MKFLGLIDKVARIIGLIIFGILTAFFIYYLMLFLNLFVSADIKNILGGIIGVFKTFKITGLYLLSILFFILLVVIFFGNLHRQKIGQNKKDNLH